MVRNPNGTDSPPRSRLYFEATSDMMRVKMVPIVGTSSIAVWRPSSQGNQSL